jgi:F-type H+-transporting ATPase subunit epsilon
MSELNLEIISAKGPIFKGQCCMAVVPSVEGEIGIMHGHESIIAKLKKGQILVYSDAQTISNQFDVESGYAEISSADKLIVLLD